MKDVLELQSSDANTHHIAKTTEHKKDDAPGQVPQHLFEGTRNEDASDKVQQNINQSVPDPITFDTSDSTTSSTISSETREAIDTLIVDLGNCLFLLNQLVREKEKEVLEDDILPYFSFEGCGTTNQQLFYLIDEYIQLINRGLLKTHANKAKASSFGFETMDIVVVFSIDKNWFYAISQLKKYWIDQHIDVVFYYLHKISKLHSMNQYKYTTVNCLFNTHIHNTHERYYNTEADDDISTKNTLTARRLYLYMRAGLPWYLVDDVYIPVNCDGRFHWVLAIVELKQRHKKKVYSREIKFLSRMLPSYLLDNDFFKKTKRTNWAELDAYKDKEIGTLLELHHPFNVEFSQDIMQQKSDILDCGLYVATFAEFLSDQLVIPLMVMFQVIYTIVMQHCCGDTTATRPRVDTLV
ncbi:hypothetical protein H5410_001067 [Solanum commersonii]|uniref:Ubiquitin-like protease family profile domain-containing protein n=1 Tax=Solanum commersonii TaxID=4109 RepID=A0A9J6AXW2_SOLCO|nr:hypothetical protein H5410_001067 [Solanum commersonii]